MFSKVFAEIKQKLWRLNAWGTHFKWSAEDGVAPPIPTGIGGRFTVSLSAHRWLLKHISLDDIIKLPIERRVVMPAYFDANKLPDPQKEYVCFIDIMGFQTKILHSVKQASNYMFKLHATLLEAWRTKAYNSIAVYPIMDGAYVTSRHKNDLLNFLSYVYKSKRTLLIFCTKSPLCLHYTLTKRILLLYTFFESAKIRAKGRPRYVMQFNLRFWSPLRASICRLPWR